MAYTINANASNIWVRDNDDTMDLSIDTEASSVYLDNGRTLEQELGEGSMVSNVATVDTSMSKVIDGTLDGAYQECVLEGRTLVNLFDKSQTKLSSNSIVSESQLATPTLKELYIIVKNPTSQSRPRISIYDSTTGNWKTNYRWSQFSQIGNVLRISLTGTEYFGGLVGSSSTSTKEADCYYESIEEFNNNNFIVQSYQDGMENWDIPYFEGICDVKMPILRNTGKNLFNINGDINQKFNNLIAELDNVLIGNNGFVANNYTYQHHGKGIILNLKSNTTYTISGKVENYGSIAIHSRNQTNIVQKQFLDMTFSFSYTTTSTTELCLAFATNGDSTTPKARFFDVQIEESPSSTIYEDHKTNILHTPSEVVLRSLPNGVKDTLNLMTGEYVQRIGEVVLNGSENWSMDTNGSGATRFYNNMCTDISIKHGTVSSNENLICDKFPHPITNIWMDTRESVQVVLPNGLYFIFNNAQSVIQWKEYLSQNTVTIQYELAEPITTIIEPIGTPFAYENGHVILESGYEGQSLLPTLDYSTITNRTGQIKSIGEQVLKQDKQINAVERLLLTNIVTMNYSNTLLKLNLTMDEVK